MQETLQRCRRTIGRLDCSLNSSRSPHLFTISRSASRHSTLKCVDYRRFRHDLSPCAGYSNLLFELDALWSTLSADKALHTDDHVFLELPLITPVASSARSFVRAVPPHLGLVYAAQSRLDIEAQRRNFIRGRKHKFPLQNKTVHPANHHVLYI